MVQYHRSPNHRLRRLADLPHLQSVHPDAVMVPKDHRPLDDVTNSGLVEAVAALRLAVGDPPAVRKGRLQQRLGIVVVVEVVVDVVVVIRRRHHVRRHRRVLHVQLGAAVFPDFADFRGFGRLLFYQEKNFA